MKDELRQGETFFADGRIEEAEKCFLNILEQDSQNKEALNNLGVIAFHGQKIERAIDYFDRSLKLDPFYKEAVLNYAYLLKELGLLHEASPYLYKIIDEFPNDIDLIQILNEIEMAKKPRKKIAVLCLPGLESFLGDIVAFLQTKYQVRTCYSNNNKEIENTIHWADVVWIEWANELAIALTNHSTLLNGKHLVCRLHSYEALAGFVQKVKWKKIDDLIFVAKHIKDIVLQQVPNLSSIVNNIHIVPNGVNLDKFVFRDRSKGKNLAYLGHINYKKGPMLLLHAFRELVHADKKFHLSIGGNFQDARYELYFSQMVKEMDLARNIQFDGWIDDVAHWLKDKHYIVCTSVLEGHPIGLMEAMASGIKPVIHNFVGARDIFPKKYLWNTIPEFCHIITSEDYSSIEYKNYIEKYYSLNRQLHSIENVISSASVMKKRKSRLNIKNNIETACISDNDFIYKSVSSGYPEEKKVTNGEIKDWYNNFLGYLKIDHERQNPRHQQIKQTLKKIIKSGMNVLDIGCGTGISSKYMGELGAEVIGVDISDELIKFAMKESAHQNVKYIVGDATQINLQKNFDAITIIDSMEHIPREKIDDFVKSICRHASKRSIIYLNIPDGRYQRYIKMNYPEKHQIIDEDYDPAILVSMFQKIGFQPYFVSIYGLDVPIQYNEYLFMTDYALENIYKQSFEKMKH